jgi:hypothetical protein
MKCLPLQFAWLLPVILVASCADSVPPATPPAVTNFPAEQANKDYWFNQPGVSSVESIDFQKLWNACRTTLINDEYQIDREDYRLGVLTTWPMISKQFFEPWRSDAGLVYGVMLDSLQTVRRSVRFDFSRKYGLYIAVPRVVMETSSHPERRITVQAQYSQAFNAAAEQPNVPVEAPASTPTRYWYALGRDEAMEKELANSVREKLGQ